MAGVTIERLIATLEAKIDKYEKNLDKAYGKTDRQFSKIERRGKQMEKRLSAIAPNFNKLLGALGVGIGARQAAQLGKSFLDAASDAEEMRSMFETVFRGASKDVEAWAETTGAAIGRSKYDLMEFAAGLQDTFVPLGFARAEGAKLSKQLVELAVDVASFKNASEPETINAFTSAIVGNHEAVRRYGIVITQAVLDQQLLSMGIKGGAKNATEQEKALARLNIIVNSTSDAQGDAARTSESFANQTKALEAAWKDLKIELGSFMRGPGTDVIGFLTRATRLASQFADRFRPLYQQSTETIDARIEEIRTAIANERTSTRGVINRGLNAITSGAKLNPEIFGSVGKLEEELELLLRLRKAQQDLEENGPQVTSFEPPIKPGPRPGSDKLDAYEREVRKITERTAAIQATTAAQSMLNPLVEDYGYTVEHAAAKQELLNAAKRAGLAITPELEASIETLADRYATTAAEAETLAASQDMLRESWATIRNTSKDVLRSFISDLREGRDATDALNNALKRLESAALDAFFNNLFASPGTAGARPAGGLFGGTIIPGILHSGGVAGKDGYGHGRSLPASTWANAGKFHSGGEVPALLKPGEIVDPGDGSVFAKHFGGVPQAMTKVVINNQQAPGYETQTRRRRGPGGEEIIEMIAVRARKMAGFGPPTEQV